MGKKTEEPKVEQPSVEAQRTYASIRDNDATIVGILGTKKKYKVRWMKNGQIDKLSRLLIRKGDTDNEDGAKDNALDAILEDSKLACKAAAIIVLDGFWKLKFRYWYLWRWFYYVRQYDNIQLQELIEEGKKKIPLTQFLLTTILLTEARATLMNMRTEEAERILREHGSGQRQGTASPDNGS